MTHDTSAETEPSAQKAQSTSSEVKPMVLVADDLTGACDASVAFVQRPGGIRVLLNHSSSVNASFVALHTGSRDLPLSDAVERLRSIAIKIPTRTEVFKKVDSVLRGNTMDEIVWSTRLFAHEIAIIAPAYPALGRSMVDGLLRASHSTSETTVDVLKGLRQRGCQAEILSPGSRAGTAEALERLILANRRIVLSDATSQEDLETIAAAARVLGRKVLWIGSGGLAQALANADGLPIRRDDVPSVRIRNRDAGAVVFFVGSDHPVTRGQVTLAQLEYGLKIESCSQDQGSGEHRLLRVECGVTSPDHIRASIKDIPTSEIGCLFMTGGDTALFVCCALGIEALEVRKEFAPGVPLCLAEGGPFHGTVVLLKSGGFGHTALLSSVMQEFAGERAGNKG